MTSLLVKNAHVMVCMDEGRREIENGGLYIEDGFIKAAQGDTSIEEVLRVIIE